MSSNLHAVFGHFQNLNLLALLADLRQGLVVRQAWRFGSQLCPISHGMPEGEDVSQLQAMGELVDLQVGCNYAAHHLCADPVDVLQFVRAWDEKLITNGSLLELLEGMWEERLADAEAMQVLLQGSSTMHEDAFPAYESANPGGPQCLAKECVSGRSS